METKNMRKLRLYVDTSVISMTESSQDSTLRTITNEFFRIVAYAVLARCDYIVSWNMRHLVNPRTMSRVNEANVLNRYPTIAIVTPSFFTGNQR